MDGDTHKLVLLPDSHTDFPFHVTVENGGIIGSVAIVLVALAVAYRKRRKQ